MSTVLFVVAAALLAVLVAAVVVASWEQVQDRRRMLAFRMACADRDEFPHTDSPFGDSETAQRAASVNDALARLARSPATPAPTRRNDPHWVETEPMVNEAHALDAPVAPGCREVDVLIG